MSSVFSFYKMIIHDNTSIYFIHSFSKCAICQNLWCWCLRRDWTPGKEPIQGDVWAEHSGQRHRMYKGMRVDQILLVLLAV